MDEVRSLNENKTRNNNKSYVLLKIVLFVPENSTNTCSFFEIVKFMNDFDDITKLELVKNYISTFKYLHEKKYFRLNKQYIRNMNISAIDEYMHKNFCYIRYVISEMKNGPIIDFSDYCNMNKECYLDKSGISFSEKYLFFSGRIMNLIVFLFSDKRLDKKIIKNIQEFL